MAKVNQLFQILGNTEFNFQLSPKTGDSDKDSKIPQFVCQSQGKITYQVSQYNQRDRSKLNSVIFLKVSTDYGLIPAFPKNGKAWNYKEILSAIEDALETKISAKNWTDNDPILLLVATYLWQSLPTAKDGQNLNALSDRVPATAQQWITAYERVEAALSLPVSLRTKFVELMSEQLELALQFETKAKTAKAKTAKAKTVDAPKIETPTSSTVPASSNGHSKAVELVTV